MTRLWAGLVLLAAILFAASPLFTDGFNGFEPGQFPVPQDDPPVQPAGYAFSIWGLIYLWLIIGAGFGLLKRSDDPDWEAMRPPLVVSLVIGAAWLPVANVSPVIATILIWVMLGTAFLSLFRVGDTDRWFQQAPVAIYAGWLTAASSVSIGLLLGGYGLLSGTWAAIVALSFGVGDRAGGAVPPAPRARIRGDGDLGADRCDRRQYRPGQHRSGRVVSRSGIMSILALRGTDTE